MGGPRVDTYSVHIQVFTIIDLSHLATGTVVSACRCTVPLMCAEVSSVNTTRFLLDSLHLGVWAESVLCTLSAQ